MPQYQNEAPYSRLGMTIKGLVLAASLGMLLGLAGFTFHYGEGWSYFSTDPAACVNCHIMRPGGCSQETF